MTKIEQKYEPKVFDDLIFSSPTQTQRFRDNVSGINGIPRPTLLLGTPGVGKSTMAKILANAFADAAWIERISGIQSSPTEAIVSLEKRLKGNPPSIFADRGAVIIDEIDELRDTAQKTLREVMDNYRHRWWFIATANNDGKIGAAMLDRMITENIRLSSSQLKERLEEIVNGERKVIDKAMLEMIISAANGSIRKAVMLLCAKL